MSTKTDKNNNATFWEHLDELRWVIFRILGALAVCFGIIFSFKELIFNTIIFPPLQSDFVFYRFLCSLGEWFGAPSFCPDDFSIQLINIHISGQFVAHLSASASMALLLIVPYILYEIWKFVSPALYPEEKKYTGTIFLSSSVLFYLGVLVSYVIVFPLTIRFLGTYQVSELVPNQISLQSYLSTLYILVFSLGLMFEMPVLAFLLSKAGLISKETLKNVRSYAFILILIIAAFITPTTDPFTMLVVALPLYMLYELSIFVCKPAVN